MKGKIFNSQEVQAIIAGTKTIFREVIKIQPANENQVFSTVASSIRNKDIGTHNFINPKATWEQTKKFKCPYQVGETIFVKEGIAHGGYFGACFVYCADGTKSNKMWQTHWSRHCRPANYMNQKQSRITLEITDVKVERLQDISEEDAIKEGVWNIQEKGSPRNWDIKNAFATFWNATHKKPEEKFEANPFVWVVDFNINK